MKVTRFGSLEAVIAGGSDREGGGDGPVVVLLHGFGAPGTDLVSLYRVMEVPRGTRFVFPAAPLEVYPGGRAWWEIDMVELDRAMREGRFRELIDRVPVGIAEARAALSEALDAIESTLLAGQAEPSRKILLGGFSQGAMLSLDFALRDGRPLAGLALFSGTLIAASEWLPRMSTRSGMRVMQSHGTHDPILPFPAAELLRDRMKEAGIEVDFVPFRGAHEIPNVALAKFAELASAVFLPQRLR